MGTFQIILMNVAVWGAIVTYYYLLHRLKRKGVPVIWWGGPKALQNYAALLTCIKGESNSVVQRRLAAILYVHFACLLGIVAGFLVLVLGHARR
jgi:hypothetical protein